MRSTDDLQCIRYCCLTAAKPDSNWCRATSGSRAKFLDRSALLSRAGLRNVPERPASPGWIKMEDWEEAAETSRGPAQTQAAEQPSSSGLNASAPTFSFNPGASSFKPTFAAAPAALPPQHSAPQAEPEPEPQPEAPQEAPPVPDDEPMAEADPPVETTSTEIPPRLPNGGQLANGLAEKLHMGEPPKPAQRKPEKAQARRPTDDEEMEEADHKIDKINAELAEEDNREHMNVVFIGHVDAGKSTTCGQILLLTGGVDERTIQKYEKEAKDNNRGSWYLAYILDTNEEERAKGKTVELARAQFTTDKKRYTILDAPGHRTFVAEMIAGAAQADVGVLIISARQGEFEAGFEQGGQTREHAHLAKTLGVTKLIVAINKMDDPSILPEDGVWPQSRYDEIEKGLTPFLRSCGYQPKRDITFLPMSGLLGNNITEPIPKESCPWYSGPTLFQVLDNAEPLPRDPLAPFRMSVIDRYRDMGTIAMGKSECGVVRKGDQLYVMPNKVPVTVNTIYRDDVEVTAAKGGENLKLRLGGIEEGEIQQGFVICTKQAPVPCVTRFKAQLQVLELPKGLFTAGYKAVLHVHSVTEECEIQALISQIDPKTKTEKKVRAVKSGALANVRIGVEKLICVEKFSKVPQLGRFTLRNEGTTIAIGKITDLPTSLKEHAPEAK